MIWKRVYGLHSRISQTASLRYKKRQYLHGKPQLLYYLQYKQCLKSLTFFIKLYMCSAYCCEYHGAMLNISRFWFTNIKIYVFPATEQKHLLNFREKSTKNKSKHINLVI